MKADIEDLVEYLRRRVAQLQAEVLECRREGCTGAADCKDGVALAFGLAADWLDGILNEYEEVTR